MRNLIGKRVRVERSGMDLPRSFVGREGIATSNIGLDLLGMASGEYRIEFDDGSYCYAPEWKLLEVKDQ